MDSGIGKPTELKSPVSSVDREAEEEEEELKWIAGVAKKDAKDARFGGSVTMTAATLTDEQTSTNAADGKTNSTSNSTRSKKLENFKKLIWAFQCFTILCVIGLFAAQIVSAHVFFAQSERITTDLALKALKEQFDAKQEIIIGFVENVDDNVVMKRFLNGEDYTTDQMEFILKEQTHLAHLEINTLLDSQGKVIASAYDKRYGSTFDPEGIVTRIIQSFQTGNSEDSINFISEVGTISKSEFELIGGKTFKGVPADGYGQRYSLLHQDTGLVLYACGSIRNDDGSLAGVKVIGYVLSGKHEFISNALFLMELDAYGGIYQLKTDGSWKPISFVRARGLSESSTYAEFDDDDNEILNEAYQKQSEVFHKHSTADGYVFTVAYAPFPSGIQSKGPQGTEESTSKTKALFSAATENARLDKSLETTTVALISFLCAIIALILTFAAVSIRCFIDPLDRLVKAAQKRDKVKTAEAFKNVGNVQGSVCIVGSGILLTCSLIIGMLLYNAERIFDNFEAQSPERQRIQQLEFFAVKDQYEFFTHAKDLSLNPILESVFSGNDSEAHRVVSEDLQEFKHHHEQSMFLVVNASFKIIASSHDLPSSAVVFNPKSIITEVITSGESIRANVLLDNTFFLSLNPNQFSNSIFQPANSKDLAVVQLIAAPVFASGSENILGASVVLTQLNANPVTVEDVDFSGEDGCAAIFYSHSGDFTLVASALRGSDQSEIVEDVNIASDELREALKKSLETQEFVGIEMIQVNGYEFEAGVNHMSPGAVYDDHGHESLTREYDDPIFLVQCSSLQRWRKLKSTVAAISSVTAIGYFVVAVGLAYATFKPIYDFGQRMGRSWGKKQSKGIILSISDAIPRLTTRSEKAQPKSGASGSAIESMKV